MSGVSLNLTYDDVAVGGALRAISAFGRDLSPLLDRIGMELESSTVDRFEEQRGPDGTPWTPSHRALADGGLTLVDSSHLRGSITHVVDGDAVEVGTNLIYGGVQQFGGTISAKAGGSLSFTIGGHRVNVASVTLPARPYLGISDVDRAVIFELVGEALFDAAGVA